MKALTISQPFASLIADGAKWVENRRWETFYRGPLLIHAGKGTQYLDADELRDYPAGCVVAVCDLAACLHVDKIRIMDDSVDRKSVIKGTRRNWSEIARHEHTEGPFCFVLENVRKLPQPIPFRGAQGLWVPSSELVTLVTKGSV
jgi:hypothetical protein